MKYQNTYTLCFGSHIAIVVVVVVVVYFLNCPFFSFEVNR
jgi:hypothetical protein